MATFFRSSTVCWLLGTFNREINRDKLYSPILRKRPAGDTLCPMDYSYDLDTEDSGHFILVSKQF